MRQMMWGVLVVVGLGVSACEYAVPSRGISADVDAALWRPLGLRDKAQGLLKTEPPHRDRAGLDIHESSRH
jgi:hypothetical protein